MSFSKVKTIICLCLLVVNIFFAFMCIRLNSEKNYISEEETNLASRNLEKKGIDVQFPKNARRLYKLPVYLVCAKGEENYIPEIYRSLTEKFFDIKVDSTAYVKTPEGYTVSVKDRKGNLIGSSNFENNSKFECLIENTVTDVDVSDIYTTSRDPNLASSKSNGYNVASDFVEAAFRNYDMEFIYKGTKQYNGGETVCFYGKLSDVETVSIFVNVYVKNGKMQCCTGEIYGTVPEKKYSSVNLDSVDAMYIITEYLSKNKDMPIKTEIEDIRMVYDSYENGYGEYYMVPTWLIEYREKSGAYGVLTIDAVRGENIREYMYTE